ncbi:DUF3080 family protein [Halioxenophilus aromaticivorans]|uniref:DUF3080 family protein n=1 Tax=Halioxenophilus aromaticivorans TaxID=1306992 RepID=UPI0031EF8061
MVKLPCSFSLLLLLLCLAGCQPKEPVDAMLADYQGRLARTLDVDSSPVGEHPLPRYPSRRELSQALTPVKIDLLEFLRLSQCDLQRLVGSRNASLGRVMSHSQRWLYEARFLTTGDLCLQLLLRDPEKVEMQSILQQALQQKRAERQRVTWNATFASLEFQSLFSAAGQPLPLLSQRPSELVSALQQLRWQVQRWHSTDVAPEANFEQLYQVLGADNWLGQLALTLVTVNNRLQTLNTIQQQRLQGRALCFNARSNPDAEAMNTVFFKYYIGQVQPYLARVSQYGTAVINEMAGLAALSADDSAEQQLWRQYWQAVFDPTDDNSQWSQMQRLLAQHTKHWQQQLQQCGLMPTR